MIFERYILRNYIGPFFFSMAVITFVFIMDFILRYIELFLSKGVKFHIVLQAFTLSLGHMFALIIPMAVLPATLMTYGTLAGENEITGMRATGMSIYRMVAPGIVLGGLLAIGLVYYNNHILPESNHRLMNLLIDINRKQPTVELDENRFIDDLQGYTIYFAEKNDRTGEIGDVQIFRHGDKHQLPTTIIAESGRLDFIEPDNILRIDLSDGEIHELPEVEDREVYRRTGFKTYTLNIRDVDRTLQRSDREYRSDREMSVRMMSDKIAEIRTDIGLGRQSMIREAKTRIDATFGLLDKDHRKRRGAAKPDTLSGEVASGASHARMVAARTQGSTQARGVPLASRSEYLARQRIETEKNENESFERQIRRYQVEIHKKYAIPFACVIFVLVGSPLAIRLGRSGMNMAVGLSLIAFLIYYVGLIGGEKLADRGFASPFLAMWAPNLLFGGLSVLLLRSAAREQPLTDFSLLRVIRSRFGRHAPANPR